MMPDSFDAGPVSMAEAIRANLAHHGHALVIRGVSEFVVTETEEGQWGAFPTPADETTLATHLFEAQPEDDYTELAEEIADWVREPK